MQTAHHYRSQERCQRQSRRPFCWWQSHRTYSSDGVVDAHVGDGVIDLDIGSIAIDHQWQSHRPFISGRAIDADIGDRVIDKESKRPMTESLAGLEHCLSWRSSGNLIASTQRFGFEGGGVGPLGRHDVIFFERNGLRHGEFALREPNLRSTIEGNSDRSSRPWEYCVREVSWNPDSTVLAVWLERNEGDVGSLGLVWRWKQSRPEQRVVLTATSKNGGHDLIFGKEFSGIVISVYPFISPCQDIASRTHARRKCLLSSLHPRQHQHLQQENAATRALAVRLHKFCQSSPKGPYQGADYPFCNGDSRHDAREFSGCGRSSTRS